MLFSYQGGGFQQQTSANQGSFMEVRILLETARWFATHKFALLPLFSIDAVRLSKTVQSVVWSLVKYISVKFVVLYMYVFQLHIYTFYVFFANSHKSLHMVMLYIGIFALGEVVNLYLCNLWKDENLQLSTAELQLHIFVQSKVVN